MGFFISLATGVRCVDRLFKVVIALRAFLHLFELYPSISSIFFEALNHLSQIFLTRSDLFFCLGGRPLCSRECSFCRPLCANRRIVTLLSGR